MTAIATNLDFETGPDGAAIVGGGSTGFTLTTPAAWTYQAANAGRGSFSAHVVSADTAASIDNAFTAVPLAWTSFLYRTPAVAPFALAYVASWRNAGIKIGDLRYMSDGSFTLRDGASQVGDPSSVTVPVNTWVRISVRCAPGSATGHRFRIYSGDNVLGSVPNYESPNLPATAAAQTSISSFRYGQVTGSTGYTYDAAFDRIRTDDAVEPAGPAAAPSTAALVATAGDGKVSLAWSIPSDGGSAITGQTITRATVETGPFTATTVQPSATDTALVDTGLTNGTTYYYRHTSTNAIGTSNAALSGAVIPAAGVTSASIGAKAPVTGTGWTFVGGAGDVILDDSDPATYAQSPDNPASSTLTIPLDTLTVPTDKTGWALDYQVQGLGSNARTVTVKLLQGTTVIATETQTMIPTVMATYTLVLTTAQATAIVATGGLASNLSLQIVATAS